MAKQKVNISGMPGVSIKSRLVRSEKKNKVTVANLLGKRIGISVSDSDEYEQLGFSKTHQKDITIELTRYLLANDAHLVFGGDLRAQGYTYAFSELSFQYRKKEEHNKMNYTNFLGWPIYNNIMHSDEADFKKNRVEIVRTFPPKNVPSNLINKKDIPDTIENKVLWAYSMSNMRNAMIKQSDARIFLGGTLSSYKGFYPGVIEEGYLTLKAKQPLYLLGAFGGATNLLIRAIKGENEKKLTKEVFDWFPGLSKLHDQLGKKGPGVSLQDMFAEFRKLGVAGLSKLNKLAKDQNSILFSTLHFHEMIYYILIGLRRKL